MTTRSQRTEPAAAETYAAHVNDIARLVDVLQMELDKHGQAARVDPANWGRVGDLAKVRSDLINVVGFISGMDRQHVEAFLSEAE